MSTLLEARNVTKVFGGGLFQSDRTVALEDFSLAIDAAPPTITAVVGESGSGKTRTRSDATRTSSVAGSASALWLPARCCCGHG